MKGYPPGNQSLTETATDTGAADAYAIGPTPAYGGYETGLRFYFKALNANTGASTLNVNGLGAKAIKKDVSVALAAGDILANQEVEVVYDGTNFQMISKKPLIAADIPTLTAAKISDFNTAVRTSKVTDLTAPSSDFSMNSHKITNVTDPGSAQDAATKAYVDAHTGKILQIVEFGDGVVVTASTGFTVDDNIPQNTNGTEIYTVSITPQFATSTIRVETMINISSHTADNVVAALYRDAVAASIGANLGYSVADEFVQIYVSAIVAAVDTAARTFKVRAGRGSANPWTVNGVNTGRIYGGKMYSFIRVTEISA